MSAIDASSLSFSFRPPPPAAELLAEIRERGGRVYRMRAPDRVFCLTSDPKLAAELLNRGARPYTTVGIGQAAEQGYRRSRDDDGVREWDVWVHTIPVAEGTTLWEAAAR